MNIQTIGIAVMISALLAVRSVLCVVAAALKLFMPRRQGE